MAKAVIVVAVAEVSKAASAAAAEACSEVTSSFERGHQRLLERFSAAFPLPFEGRGVAGKPSRNLLHGKAPNQRSTQVKVRKTTDGGETPGRIATTKEAPRGRQRTK